MKAPQENTQEPQKNTVQRLQQEPSTGGEATITDNRPSSIYQCKLREGMDASVANTTAPIQRKSPRGSSRFQQIATSMGDKYGVDTSRLVATHNSSFPAQLGAAATIQGSNIHFAPNMDTDHNIKHEVAHAIDNNLHGTPKGDKLVNGQNVDTTREKIVDRIADGHRATHGLKNAESGTFADNKKSESNKMQKVSHVIQRRPLPFLGIIKTKLRAAGFTLTDNNWNVSDNGDTSTVTIRRMNHGTVNFDNVVLNIVGASAGEVVKTPFTGLMNGINRYLSLPVGPASDPDLARTMDLSIEHIITNNLAVGHKQQNIALDDIMFEGITVNKIPGVLSLLTHDNPLLRTFLGWLPQRIGVTQQSQNNKMVGDVLDMLGVGTRVTIGEVRIETLPGSEARREGKGGYTGQAGRLETRSEVKGNLRLNGIELDINQVPQNGQGEYQASVGVDALIQDQHKKKRIVKGKKTLLSKVKLAKFERTKFEMTNLHMDIHQDTNHFELNGLHLQLEDFTFSKGIVKELKMNNVDVDIKDNGEGEVEMEIFIKHKLGMKNNILFRVVIPVHGWVITIDDILAQVRTGLDVEGGMNSFQINTLLKLIRNLVVNYNDPGAMRRIMEVFDPQMPNSPLDVVVTNNDNKVTGINIANLLNYHLAARMEQQLRR